MVGRTGVHNTFALHDTQLNTLSIIDSRKKQMRIIVALKCNHDFRLGEKSRILNFLPLKRRLGQSRTNSVPVKTQTKQVLTVRLSFIQMCKQAHKDITIWIIVYGSRAFVH